MKKIAIYCRVSTTDQTTENQILRLTEYCNLKNLSFDIYQETQSSRKTRPVKAGLLSKLRNNEYSGVLVYRLDRWARSSTELLLEINELISKGITFCSYSEQLDFSTATGKLHFTILSAFAEFERNLIRDRTLEGLHRAKSQGKCGGRPVGSKDSKKRKTDGYVQRWVNNPPLNNSQQIYNLQNPVK
ncbi:MAG TPA: recombinase family protein [Bacteroidia bacterium]|nr:recombinase family protein [Bacteroidia bacterium]